MISLGYKAIDITIGVGDINYKPMTIFSIIMTLITIVSMNINCIQLSD